MKKGENMTHNQKKLLKMDTEMTQMLELVTF